MPRNSPSTFQKLKSRIKRILRRKRKSAERRSENRGPGPEVRTETRPARPSVAFDAPNVGASRSIHPRPATSTGVRMTNRKEGPNTRIKNNASAMERRAGRVPSPVHAASPGVARPAKNVPQTPGSSSRRQWTIPIGYAME
ncbi:hypothetical protein MPDQ_000115 [Monascus purpureus]|uniref:Uncharacterized protein n=1 Tax=Monascus purpureus TaxID=5098 RepID=A0A507R6T1_MONPU|nr:hypothetical protein MPDQ_000115 [Monascus purpureus]